VEFQPDPKGAREVGSWILALTFQAEMVIKSLCEWKRVTFFKGQSLGEWAILYISAYRHHS